MRGATATFPDYSVYSTSVLLSAFEQGPSRLRRAIEGLSEPDFRARARGPGSWSIHEIVIHTGDSELQGAYRIKKLWAEPPQLWPVYDQDLWTSRLGYQDQGASARDDAIALVEILRRQTLPLFERATPAEWARHGEHPEMGRMTLRNLLELYADHIERHIEQILTIRRLLGRETSMSPMLPRRLY